MLKNIPLIVLFAASLVACGGSDNKKSSSSSSAALSSSTPATSSTPAASSTPASSADASSTATSTAVSSSLADSSVASSEASSLAASSVIVVASSSSAESSTAASSSPASSSAISSSEASSSVSSQAGTTYTFTSVDGWSVNGGGSPNQMQVELNAASGSGINLVPVDWAANAATNYKYEARYTLPAATNIAVGTKISYTLSIPQSYITDATVVLQINWGIAGGTYKYGGSGGGYKTISTAGGVVAGTDFVITETVTSGNDVAGTTTLGIQLSKAPTDTSLKDKILVKSITIE